MQTTRQDPIVDKKMKPSRDKEEELEQPPKKKQCSRDWNPNSSGWYTSEQYIASAIVALGDGKSEKSSVVSPLHMPQELKFMKEEEVDSDDDDSVQIVPQPDSFSLENTKQPDPSERYIRSDGNEVSTAPCGVPLPPPPSLPRCRLGGVVLHDLRKDQGKVKTANFKNWL